MMEQYSPKTSPRGARSPSVSGSLNHGGQMEGGNLKLSIALGQKPTIIQKGPFYLMKQEAIPASEVTGATNLMASKGLEHSYIKLTSKSLNIFETLNLKSSATRLKKKHERTFIAEWNLNCGSSCRKCRNIRVVRLRLRGMI